jgi:hypothetical protein
VAKNPKAIIAFVETRESLSLNNDKFVLPKAFLWGDR